MIMRGYITGSILFGVVSIGWQLDAATILQRTLPSNPSGSSTQNAAPQKTLPGKAIHQPALKAVEEAKRVVFTRGTPQWVSWGYLRTYQPAMVASLLGSVKSGALAAGTIAGLAHPNDVQILLKNVRVPPGPGAQPKTSRFSLSTVATAPAYSYLPMRVVPEKIDFGAMLVGQAVSSRVRLISPADGTVRISIPDGAFRIRSVLTHTGEFHTQNVTIPLPNGGTRQTIVMLPTVAQQITAPPWNIPVKAGQDVEAFVDVTTQRNVKLGEHLSEVQVAHSNGRSGSAPIHARLDGLLYGIGINVDGQFYVLPGNDLLIPFEWYNEGEAGTATLTLENLPAGFAVLTPPQGVTLTKGQRQKANVLIHVADFLAKPGGYGTSAVLPFKITNGPTHLTYGINVTVVPPWVHQAVGARAFFSDGEEVDVRGFLELRSDGWFLFSGEITSSGTGKGFGVTFDSIYRYDVGITLPGGFSHAVHGSFGHGDIGGRSSTTKDTWSESGNNIPLAQNFIANIRGLSNTDPSIHITRSTF